VDPSVFARMVVSIKVPAEGAFTGPLVLFLFLFSIVSGVIFMNFLAVED